LGLSRSKKGLLFEKRSKNFWYYDARVAATRASISKSFLVLFCKKELLPFLAKARQITAKL
jgi:hypothetical protein